LKLGFLIIDVSGRKHRRISRKNAEEMGKKVGLMKEPTAILGSLYRYILPRDSLFENNNRLIFKTF